MFRFLRNRSEEHGEWILGRVMSDGRLFGYGIWVGNDGLDMVGNDGLDMDGFEYDFDMRLMTTYIRRNDDGYLQEKSSSVDHRHR